MPIIALHTSTVHLGPLARGRLLMEAQSILADRMAPEFRRRLAASFIANARTPLSDVLAAGDGATICPPCDTEEGAAQ